MKEANELLEIWKGFKYLAFHSEGNGKVCNVDKLLFWHLKAKIDAMKRQIVDILESIER